MFRILPGFNTFLLFKFLFYPICPKMIISVSTIYDSNSGILFPFTCTKGSMSGGYVALSANSHMQLMVTILDTASSEHDHSSKDQTCRALTAVSVGRRSSE